MSSALPATPSASGGDTWPELVAPQTWRTIDFISDLHLHAGEPETFAAWRRYMQASTAQAVFVLGDLFEAWAGDDVVAKVGNAPSEDDDFEERCAQVLQQCVRQRDVFFMRGNRDFLVGEAFTQACGVQLLHDPTILVFAQRRWLLSHGDALCLDDKDYMAFRAMVRDAQWQTKFLAQPLAQRKAIARELRERSEAHKQSQPVMVDVDPQAAMHWLKTADASWMIHGHTHRPAEHALGGDHKRIVLSDWDLRADPPRAQVLRIGAGSGDAPAVVQRLPLAAA